MASPSQAFEPLALVPPPSPLDIPEIIAGTLRVRGQRQPVWANAGIDLSHLRSAAAAPAPAAPAISAPAPASACAPAAPAPAPRPVASTRPDKPSPLTLTTSSTAPSRPSSLAIPPAAKATLSIAPHHAKSASFTQPASTRLSSPQGFRTHRQNALSVESIPRQTMLKARVSAKARGPSSAGLHSSLTLRDDAGFGNEGLSSAGTPNSVADSLKHPLQSPCFFHENFDDAINIDKVLEEVQADSEYMSHHRLLQTATGVREVARQLQRKPIKMQVRSVMIVTKARDNTLVTLTREVAHWLLKTPRYGSDLGVTVYVDEKLKKSKRFDADGLISSEPRFGSMLKYWTPDLCWTSPEKFDLVLTLGGDGTVLFTSWLFQRVVPPILSFSLGSLGFMTNFRFEMYKEHLDKVMTEGMRINMRMRFTCTVYRDSKGHMDEAEQFEVLNELVIDRGPSPYVSNLELYGDDDLLTVVQADGCIFSTPTGSTAYSLSAGGSLVHPDIPAILLTPICPHTLSFRPMLLNDSMLLRVSVPRSSRATAYCAFDGKGRIELKQGDHVTIAASQYPFPTVLSSGTEWFDSIARTLRWNSRGAQQKAWSGESVSGGDSALGDEDEGEPEWDIDTDSNVYSDDSGSNSPLKRAMLLGV
ncbi:ATP-NAD kinase-like domain-containing protein [Peziza echinospora]|nr:ATP-NAD kinase-like domain-containing protein [Peziza echinospora]